MREKRRNAGIVTAVVGVVAFTGLVHAGAIPWDNSATDFNADASWTGGAAPADDLTTDTGVFSGAVVNQPELTASRQIGGLDFQTGGWALGNTGAFTLTLGGAGLTTAGAVSSGASFEIGASQTWNLGGNLTLGAALKGGSANTLVKTGAGTLNLYTVASNTFNGTLIINGGTVGFSGTSSNTATTNFANIVINNGTLNLADNELGNANGAIVVNAGSTGSNQNGYGIIPNSSDIVINQGTLAGSGTLNFRIDGLLANLITVQGNSTLDITSLTLNLVTSNLESGNSYVIADYTAGSLTGGAFAGVTGFSPGAYTIEYSAGVGNQQIVLTVVPEPLSVAGLGVGAVWLIGRRRNKLS